MSKYYRAPPAPSTEHSADHTPIVPPVRETAAVFLADAVHGDFSVSAWPQQFCSSAASDGGLRRLNLLESPESWFEDFGRAEVIQGQASVDCVLGDLEGLAVGVEQPLERFCFGTGRNC
jgi:hypothetical protein